MSVSIALLPVALAMRIIMGKENFDNWVSAQQVKVPSAFGNESELIQTLKKAGYDAIKYGSLIKTHLSGEKSFFFWELIDGKWIAIFSKSDDKNALDKFKYNVEMVAGRQIFGDITTVTTQQLSQKYPTNFRDGNILIEALVEFGSHPSRQSNGSIICKIERSELTFTQVADSPFVVEVKNTPNLEEVYQYMSNIDDDYKRCVQTAVYEKVKQRASERNMVVVSEDVLVDKSIIITLQLS